MTGNVDVMNIVTHSGVITRVVSDLADVQGSHGVSDALATTFDVCVRVR